MPLDFCLLIPCYNNAEGLMASLYSVNYYRERYLVVVVDDGSDKPIKSTDDHVIILRNETNLGITQSLNKGLQWILTNTDARYVARLDCGDTCSPNRFNRLVQFLNEHNKVALVGSWCMFSAKDEEYYSYLRQPDKPPGWFSYTPKKENSSYIYKTPLTESGIRNEMYNRNVFIHPTVMFTRKVVEEIGVYPNCYPLAEDYAYFWMILNKFPVAILPELLVNCEINKLGLSYPNKRRQFRSRIKVVLHFGSNRWRKIAGIIRLGIVFLLPKRLSLFLKAQKK